MVCLVISMAADEFKQVGTITSDRIRESSGLAASRRYPGHLWTHNDSGDDARVYLLNSKGKLRGIAQLKKVDAIDVEDICQFDWNGQSWLLVADVGDNLRRRGKKKNTRCRLFLLPEPDLKPKKDPSTKKFDVETVIEFEFEDGRWDCESVAVDTSTNSILLITKELPHKSGVFRLPLTLDAKGKQTAQRIAKPMILFATAADISPNGRQLVVNGMGAGLMYHRDSKESWADCLKRPGQIVELPARRQGEAICFALDGQSLFVSSEGSDQPLWNVPLVKSKP